MCGTSYFYHIMRRECIGTEGGLVLANIQFFIFNPHGEARQSKQTSVWYDAYSKLRI